MSQILNIATILMSTTTMFGILFHDMSIDKAASVALKLPSVVATSGAMPVDGIIKRGNAHTHVDNIEAPKRSSARTMPSMKTPDRKTSTKKSRHQNGSGKGIVWPSR